MSIESRRILTAFQPAKEISDPKRFAGRRAEIEIGAELLTSKNHIFIYGPRGIGKSSIAKQLEIIANGNTELLEDIDSPLKDIEFSFATCFFTRDESVNNVNQLLYRLMIDETGFAKFPFLFSKFGEVAKYELKRDLDARLVADFRRRAIAIAEKNSDGLIIFIDEFELIQNHEGFSSLLKAAPEGVVFVITGIATTELELVRDHLSIERQLTTGKLPLHPMTPAELDEVVNTAELSIKKEIQYDRLARDELVRLVAGQPYLLHLIGRESLLSAFRNKKKIITFEDLHISLSEIALKRTDSTLEDKYLKAIGNSSHREIVMRAFAGVCNPNTHTTLVYPIAEAHGVNNISTYVADLQKVVRGEVLKKISEQHYTFRDPLFQAYAVATPRRLSQDNIEEGVSSSTLETRNFSLLHFSDLHFGEAHYFSKLPSAIDQIPVVDKPTLDRFVNAVIFKDQLKPNLLVISGDITQRGTSSEFTLAKKSLDNILENIKNVGGNPNIMITPGNHDVNWNLINGDPEVGIGFQPYINFRNQIFTHNRIDVPIAPERLYEVRKFVADGVTVISISLNSAVLINSSDQRGYIGDNQIDNAIQEANLMDESFSAVRIAIFHHHLIPVHSIESAIGNDAILTDAPRIKQKLYSAKFSIILHGHRHHGHEEMISDGKNQLIVIGCGSSAVILDERGSQPLQFNSISIQLLKLNTAVHVTRYTFDASRSEWITQAPKIFSLDRSHS